MTESLPDPFADLRLRPQSDWPVERQRAFLRELLRGGDLKAAAARVGTSADAVKRFRRLLGRRSAFSLAWRHAVDEAKFDAAATHVLRRGGLNAEQLAQIDAVCHGAEKVRFALALFHHGSRADKARATGGRGRHG